MKRFMAVMMAVMMVGGLFACSKEKGPKGGGSGNFAAGMENAASTSSSQYMEYMYDDENGKNLNQAAASGSLIYANNQSAVKTKLNAQLKASLAEHMGAPGDRNSANWWERADVDQDALFDYVRSTEGQALLDAYYGVKKKSAGGGFGNWSVSMGGDINLSSFSLDSFFLDIDGGNEAQDNSEVTGRLQQIMNKLNEICQSLQTIQNSIHNLERQLYNIQVFVTGEKLEEARNEMQGFLVEVSTITGLDYSYRAQMIKDFILKKYEKMYLDAYDSAVARTAAMNARPENTVKIPFKMMLEDIVFIRQMSLLRLTFASSVFHGNELLQYRANVARVDLLKAKDLKNSINAAYNQVADKDYLVEAFSLVMSWEIILRAHIEQIYEPDPNNVEGATLEEGSNLANGFGTFGDSSIETANIGYALADTTGTLIMSRDDFAYGQILSGMFDPNPSGNFDSGKYMRIVVNGKNITDPNGLGLVPIAVNFAEGVQNPLKYQCYIDPMSGQFTLPRPSYWSRCESVANLVNAEIRDDSNLPTVSGLLDDFSPQMFGNGVYLHTWTGGYATKSGTLMPFGSKRGSESGTVSYWGAVEMQTAMWSALGCYVRTTIGNVTLTQSGHNNPYTRTLNLSIGSYTVSCPIGNGHVYLCWDKQKRLEGNKSVRVFMNGVEVLSATQDIEPGQISISMLASYARPDGVCDGWANSYLDNLMIWNHVVSENPAWLYNNGVGREDALHIIYGVYNNYRPQTVSVGYYYVR